MHPKARTIFISIAIVAIITIGYTINITYKAFLTRSKIGEAFLLTQPVQNTIYDYAKAHDGFPVAKELTNSSFGLPQPFEIQGTYLSSIVAHKDNGLDEVTIFAYINLQTIPGLEDGNDNPLYGPYLKFNGKYNGKNIEWKCSSNLAKRYLPKDCAGS
jgi:hypothetical protein